MKGLDLRHLDRVEKLIYNHFVRRVGYFNYDEIGFMLGVSRQAVEQIEVKIIRKLRSHMADELREYGLSNLVPVETRGRKRRESPVIAWDRMTEKQRENRKQYERRKAMAI